MKTQADCRNQAIVEHLKHYVAEHQTGWDQYV